MLRVLLIDDDEQLGPPLAAYLHRFQIELTQSLTPSEGLLRLRSRCFDAVILDIMLPEMDGFGVCRVVRLESDIPIIMLTARGDLTDRVVGLELGADDYLPKPFEPRELVARLQTVIRRTSSTRRSEGTSPREFLKLDFEGLSIDTARRTVFRLGEAVDLTGTEYELLLALARQPSHVLTRDEILNEMRGQDTELFGRAVDIVVSRLRKKLQPLHCIKTLRNAGYTFALPRRKSA